MPREPPVMSAALPASEIIEPPRSQELTVESPAPRNLSLLLHFPGRREIPRFARNDGLVRTAANSPNKNSRTRGGRVRGLQNRAEKRRPERVAVHPPVMPLNCDDPVLVRFTHHAFRLSHRR